MPAPPTNSIWIICGSCLTRVSRSRESFRSLVRFLDHRESSEEPQDTCEFVRAQKTVTRPTPVYNQIDTVSGTPQDAEQQNPDARADKFSLRVERPAGEEQVQAHGLLRARDTHTHTRPIKRDANLNLSRLSEDARAAVGNNQRGKSPLSKPIFFFSLSRESHLPWLSFSLTLTLSFSLSREERAPPLSRGRF